jgi:hypothetical protein
VGYGLYRDTSRKGNLCTLRRLASDHKEPQ